jgi:DNA polymerase III epsilon subunit-like protein
VKHLILDCETELIGSGRLVPRVACVSSCFVYSTSEGDDLGSPDLWRAEAPDFVELLTSWVLDSSGFLVGHNIAFDLACLARAVPSFAWLIWRLYDQGRVWDTGLHERLKALGLGWSVHPAIGRPIVSQGVSLSQLVLARLGVDMSSTKLDKNSPRFAYGGLVDVPLSEWSQEARRYALDDAQLTARVFVDQIQELPRLSSQGLNIDQLGGGPALASFGLQVRAAWALHHLGAWGLRSAPERVEAWRAELESKKEKLSERPRALGLIKPDGRKDLKALRAAVELAYGSGCPRTEKGAASTSSETLIGSGAPALVDLGKLAAVDKLLGTYGPVLDKAARGPLNPRWNTLVATGRTSCLKPNLQNLPRGGSVREAFTPRAGCVYIGADYSTAELVALSQVCINWGFGSKMGEAINAGFDLHLMIAAESLGISYEQALERRAAGCSEVSKARQRAKITNFGLPGGRGAQGLVDDAEQAGLEMSIDEAKELRAKWFKTWPEMGRYFERVESLIERGGVYQEKSGRRRGGVGFTDGANTFFQGLIADAAKSALYEVVRACFMLPDSPLYGVRPVLFVHDEIICECPEDMAPEAADELARLMVEHAAPWVPDVKLGADAWVSRVWRKGLEGSRDEAGRLMVLD